MLSFLTTLSLFSAPTELDTSSLSAMYNSLEYNESMYVHGYNIRKEITRTRQGVFTRDVTGANATVVRFTGADSTAPITVISEQEWEPVNNPEALGMWLEEFQSIDGSGFDCSFGVRVYTVYARNAEIEIRDDTCRWNARRQLQQVYETDRTYLTMEAIEQTVVASN